MLSSSHIVVSLPVDFRFCGVVSSLLGERDGGLSVHEGKHLSADGEREGDDEEPEEHHLCYEQEEDLCGRMVSSVFDVDAFDQSRTRAIDSQDCSRESSWQIDFVCTAE